MKRWPLVIALLVTAAFGPFAQAEEPGLKVLSTPKDAT